MPSLLLICLIVAGLVVGSLLTRVIHRIPVGDAITSRSRCPACASRLTIRDTVPVISWLVLYGRCRHCAAPISPRYPLVELGTAAIFVTVAFQMGQDAAMPAMLVVAAASVALTVIDVQRRRLPTLIIRVAYMLTLTGLLAAATVGDQWPSLLRAVAASASIGGFHIGLALIAAGSFGWGDVRLSFLLALAAGWFGWAEAVVGVLAAFTLAAGWGMVTKVLRAGAGSTTVPFGPFMVVGAVVGIAFGEDFNRLYAFAVV